MIDMNGLFHNSAQKVYEYGNFKPKSALFVKDKIILHLYELKNFIENRLLNFEKGNKRLWSMS